MNYSKYYFVAMEELYDGFFIRLIIREKQTTLVRLMHVDFIYEDEGNICATI